MIRSPFLRIRAFLAARADVPREIRVISWATAIRWIGWGMCEPLIPVFLFIAIGSYTVSGAIGNIGSIVFLLLFPVAGVLADRMSLKAFLIIGLLFFIGDAAGYLLTGLTGVVLFVVMSGIFDGVAVVADVIGRATYIRRTARPGAVAFAFGWSEAVITAGWMAGMLLAVVLVGRLGMLWMFAALIPTTLVTVAMYARGLPPERRPAGSMRAAWSLSAYHDMWRLVRSWPAEVRRSVLLMLLLSSLAAIGSFVVPIVAFTQGASLSQVILLDVVFNLPALAGGPIGRVADALGKRSAPLGLAIAALTLVTFATVSAVPLQLVLLVILQFALTLARLAVDGGATVLVASGEFGRISALLEALKDFGKFVGPVLFGLVADSAGGTQAGFLLAAGVTAIVALRVARSPDLVQRG